MTPLVSVIIATYKRPKYLIRAINSVLNQTYKNIEIIVIDDNNENDEFRKLTENVLKKLIDENKIIYIKHKYNKGCPASRNTGIKNAKGEFISFLDDDDEYLPTKTDLQLKIFQNKKDEIGLVYGAYIRKDLNLNKESLIEPKFKGNVNFVLGLNKIGSPSIVMCKKSAIIKIGGFDETLPYKEDIDFFFRLSEYYNFDYTREVVVKYYIHSNERLSFSYKYKLSHTIQFIRKHYPKIKRPRARWSEIQEWLGALYLLNDNKKLAFIAYARAYINRPTRLSIIIRICLIFLGKRIFGIKNNIINYFSSLIKINNK